MAKPYTLVSLFDLLPLHYKNIINFYWKMPTRYITIPFNDLVDCNYPDVEEHNIFKELEVACRK